MGGLPGSDWGLVCRDCAIGNHAGAGWVHPARVLSRAGMRTVLVHDERRGGHGALAGGNGGADFQRIDAGRHSPIKKAKDFARTAFPYLFDGVWDVSIFTHEFLRDTPRIIGPITGYQIAALAVALLGAIGFVVRQRNGLRKGWIWWRRKRSWRFIIEWGEKECKGGVFGRRQIRTPHSNPMASQAHLHESVSP